MSWLRPSCISQFVRPRFAAFSLQQVLKNQKRENPQPEFESVGRGFDSLRSHWFTSAFLVIVWLAPYPENYPWSPDAACQLNPAKPDGLHPAAYSALSSLTLAHRITQGINHSPGRGNVHDTDGRVNGNPYTGAVDISVRCLSQGQIRTLLARLADAGFAGWYRKDGQDGWTGPPHIHAIWVGCSLKPVLRQQVEDWLAGGNGLYSNSPYQFWQASAEMKQKVGKLYHSRN